MKSKTILITLLITFLILLSGCKNNDTTDVNNQIDDTQKTAILDYSVEFEQNEYNIKIGESITPKYTINQKYNSKVLFNVSDKSIASVDSNGKVTAISKGQTILTLTLSDGTKCETIINVEVIIPCNNIDLQYDNITLGVGEEFTLPMIINPENADISDINFSSSDKSVATVNKNGVVKAIKKGKSVISISIDNGKKLDFVVNVLNSPTKLEAIVEKELYYLYSYKVEPKFLEDEYSGIILYSSSDKSIVEIDEKGNLTLHNKGKAIITATTYNGISIEIEVEVIGVYISEMRFKDSRKTFGVGEDYSINLSLSPTNATLDDVELSSSNNDVLEIDKNGKINFKKSGDATITAIAKNGKYVKYDIFVMKEPSELFFNYSDTKLYLNQVINLDTYFNDDEFHSSVKYTSSNSEIASIDDNGYIKALSKGTTTITATVYNGISKSIEVTVDDNHAYANSITISKPSQFLQVGNNYSLNVEISPSNVSKNDISFKSSNTNVVSVDKNGDIKINGTGTVTITATTFNGLSSSTSMTINVINYTKPYTSTQVYKDINYLKNYYPGLINASIIGYSEQGKEIPLVKVGNGSKKACIVAGIHSTEHITISFTMRCIEEYAQAYYSKSLYGGYDIYKLLNEYTLYVVPMVNPDGLDISTGSNNPLVDISNLVRDRYKRNANGVNLNRNFPYEWDSLDELSLSSENYQGVSAGSESETQTIIRLCANNDFEWLLDMHIVGNGIYWRDVGNGKIDGDYSLASRIADKCGYYMFEITEDIQDYAGGLENWFRYEYNRPALCIELVPSSKAYITNTNLNYNAFFEEILVWNKTKYTFLEAMS